MKKSKANKTEVVETKPIKPVQTKLERLVDYTEDLQSEIDRNNKLCKESLLKAIRTMREFLTDAERDINNQQDYETLLGVVKAVSHNFGWGVANSQSHISTAIRYAEEYTTYKAQLDLIKQYEILPLITPAQENIPAGLNLELTDNK